MVSLSMTSIKNYMRCPKSFEFMNIHGLEDQKPKSVAIENGTHFHQYMEYAATGRAEELDWDTEMGRVAKTYLKHNPLPGNILSADKQHSFMLYPDVKITFSRDLVYQPNPKCVIVRDWKTFSRLPTYDIDLDFQGRFYIWATMHTFPDIEYAGFELAYCRTEEPLVFRGPKKDPWTIEQCYPKVQQMVLSKEELADDALEFMEIIDEILHKVRTNARFRRHPQKAGGYSDCSSCFVKDMCKSQKQGTLDLTNPWATAQKTDRGTIFE